jgi:ribosomal protein L28
MKACDVCGKKSIIQKSGAHRYGGGWAMRATKKRKVWEPNLHSVKVTYQGVRKTMRLCTKCLRRVKAQMVLEAKKKDIPDAKIAQAVSA